MPGGSVRQPRCFVSCAGGNVNVIEAEVTLVRGSGTASTFEAKMALDEASNPGAGFWSDTAPLTVSIVATDGSGNSGTLITGDVIEVIVDFKDRTVSIHGQDKTQDLIAARTDKKWENTPISAIVSELATGLGTSIDGGTQMAGRLGEDGQTYTFNSDNESNWDVIQELAEEAGKIAFVDQNQLFFVNPGEPNEGNYSVTYTPPTSTSPASSNVAFSLICRRDLQVAQGVTGQVASYRSRDQEPNNVQTGQE